MQLGVVTTEKMVADLPQKGMQEVCKVCNGLQTCCIPGMQGVQPASTSGKVVDFGCIRCILAYLCLELKVFVWGGVGKAHRILSEL